VLSEPDVSPVIRTKWNPNSDEVTRPANMYQVGLENWHLEKLASKRLRWPLLTGLGALLETPETDSGWEGGSQQRFPS
jgi:hypothetical protein